MTAKVTLSFTVKESKSIVQCFITEDGEDDISFKNEIEIGLTVLANELSKLSVLTPEDSMCWDDLENPLEIPNEEYAKKTFKNCLEKVVSTGSSLYKKLKEKGLKTILEAINSLSEGSIININTDYAFFPWEILYPSDYHITWTEKLKQQNPINSKLFWGYKFIINYYLLPENGQIGKTGVKEHKAASANISFNLNPTIENEFDENPFKPIQHHREFYDSFIQPKGEYKTKSDEIIEYLLSDNKATIIYLYCHGSNDSPFNENCVEKLELDDGVFFEPDTLNYENKYKCKPIIFLNSCNSAKPSLVSFSSFHKQFKNKGAIGIIGTNIQIPSKFAAAFGTKIIKGYLEGMALGIVLYKLRRELIDKENILALFYSLQCPWNVMKGDTTA